MLFFFLFLDRSIISTWYIDDYNVHVFTGFPIALSYPHFYQADPSLQEAIDGLNPNSEEHESFFHIQPKSGLPVELATRFQINMALQDIGHMAHVEKFANMVLPMLWFEIVSFSWLYLIVDFQDLSRVVIEFWGLLIIVLLLAISSSYLNLFIDICQRVHITILII